VPETPETLHRRAAAVLRMPPVGEWDTFPFDGEMRPRQLRPPTDVDPPREGVGGVNCSACAAEDDRYLWTSERRRLLAPRPSGLPVVVLLEPRDHYAEPGDLPAPMASELGEMIVRVERAVRAVEGVGRVHVCRWGDGAEHLHWWFMARPARMPQLLGSFAAVWDDVLPATPDDIWTANLAQVGDNLRRIVAV
jgi:diadenosine tetraphosphate (Ap4A) HIT family hydrolase